MIQKNPEIDYASVKLQSLFSIFISKSMHCNICISNIVIYIYIYISICIIYVYPVTYVYLTILKVVYFCSKYKHHRVYLLTFRWMISTYQVISRDLQIVIIIWNRRVYISFRKANNIILVNSVVSLQ